MFDFHNYTLKGQDKINSTDEKIETIRIKQLNHHLKINSLDVSLKKYNLVSIEDEKEWNPTIQLRCGICWGTIKEGDRNISECPFCSRKFHTAHWIDWINKKSYCPTCRKSLRSPS